MTRDSEVTETALATEQIMRRCRRVAIVAVVSQPERNRASVRADGASVYSKACASVKSQPRQCRDGASANIRNRADVKSRDGGEEQRLQRLPCVQRLRRVCARLAEAVLA